MFSSDYSDEPVRTCAQAERIRATCIDAMAHTDSIVALKRRLDEIERQLGSPGTSEPARLTGLAHEAAEMRRRIGQHAQALERVLDGLPPLERERRSATATMRLLQQAQCDFERLTGARGVLTYPDIYPDFSVRARTAAVGAMEREVPTTDHSDHAQKKGD